MSSQLVLGLFSEEPWDGQAPRALTRGSRVVFLRRKPQKDERFFVDPDQLDLFRAAKRRPRGIYSGAPLLIPFEEETRDDGEEEGI